MDLPQPTGPPQVDVTRHLTQGSHVYQGGGGVGQAHRSGDE